jgi:hypothetical protein
VYGEAANLERQGVVRALLVVNEREGMPPRMRVPESETFSD